MILLDYSQVAIAGYFAHYRDEKPSIGLFRHVVLQSILSTLTRFKRDYGQLVVCCDGPNYWRTQVFPLYKASRKRDMDSSDFDWKELFHYLSVIREEIRVNFPYRVLRVEEAESDDVIAVLASRGGPNVIVSGDKDFKQLHGIPFVRQWSPFTKDFVTVFDAKASLREHVLRGDPNDGIPNFLSDDDAIFNPDKRQKSITRKKLTAWMEQDPSTFETEQMRKGFQRNETLIDFSKIPERVVERINSEFDSYQVPDRSRMFDYFRTNQLSKLMPSIQDF